MKYELSPNYVPLSPLPLKVGVMSPVPMGAPTMVMIDEGMKNDLGELAATTLDLSVKNIVHLDS